MLPKGPERWVTTQNQLFSLFKWEGHGKFSTCLRLFINFSVQPWLEDVFVSGSLLAILTKERNQEAGARAQDPCHLLARTGTGKFTLQRKDKSVSH